MVVLSLTSHRRRLGKRNARTVALAEFQPGTGTKNGHIRIVMIWMAIGSTVESWLHICFVAVHLPVTYQTIHCIAIQLLVIINANINNHEPLGVVLLSWLLLLLFAGDAWTVYVGAVRRVQSTG